MDTGGIIYGCLTPHPPILVPAIAGQRMKQVTGTRTAMLQVAREVSELRPDVIVLVSPHAPISSYSMGICVAKRYAGGFEAFGMHNPRLMVEGDAGLAAELREACRAYEVPATVFGRSDGIQQLDHGAAVPLFFLQEAGVEAPLVLLAFSGLDSSVHRQFGKAISAAVRRAGRRAVLVASGDLSHRLTPGAPAGYSPTGKQFDDAIVRAIRMGDNASIFDMDEGLRSQAGECGYRSVVIALAAMPEARPEVLSYEGPFGVGYLVARLVGEAPPAVEQAQVEERVAPPGLEPDEAAALDLARAAVEGYVRTGRTVSAPARPEGLLAQSAGVFVSLKIRGDLRGCIGTFQPTEANIANEIVRNAIASASRDPRFSPVSPEELESLDYSVDILSAPERVENVSQLDPKRYGVIVQAGSRKGLLLPDLEGVNTVQAQLDIAKRKAGIAWGETVKMFRFTVRRLRR